MYRVQIPVVAFDHIKDLVRHVKLIKNRVMYVVSDSWLQDEKEYTLLF